MGKTLILRFEASLMKISGKCVFGSEILRAAADTIWIEKEDAIGV